MFAARKKSGEDVKVGIREQPTFGMFTGGFGGANDGAQMPAAGYTVKMVDTDSREAGDLLIGKELLA